MQAPDDFNLIDCYQIQVDTHNQIAPMFLGKYREIPLPVNKIVEFDKYKLHVVTYVMSGEEIANKIYKIVGVNVFRGGEDASICALDLVAQNDGFELVFSNHQTGETEVVEKLEYFPPKHKVLEYVISRAFEEPVKSILLSPV